MLPCLKEENLSLFSATADQRYRLGKETFLKTHFPVKMKRYLTDSSADTWTEEDLLQDLQSEVRKNNISGNRAFVLYGAAGTGKSEVMRWLYCHLKESKSGPYILRISRTELDPVQILHKILSQFTQKGFDISVLQGWEDLKTKPVTLANRLIWSALAEMLPSDEEIIPLSYRLRPLVEKNLRRAFTSMEDAWEGNAAPPELISLEDLEEMVRDSSLPMHIDCEKLHYQMGRELEDAALGGLNFVSTLKSVSQEIYNREGIRPLLLIDDLVQSMNVYATDLMDYFITLEEGNWDVILGLTPSSFETTMRGREMLDRIQYLDTFGDRMAKLWISDQQGYSSFVVTLENCHLFASKYLAEYKSMTGFNCGSGCPFAKKCLTFQQDEDNLSLLPFNIPLLKRIYKSLPEGKGKPRYFILALGEMLRKMARQDWVGALDHQLEKELAADHPSMLLRIFAESYAPEITEDQEYVEFDGRGVNWLIGEQICQNVPIKISMTVLSSRVNQGHHLEESNTTGKSISIDPGKAAIRDWLNSQTVNKELLKGLRLGVAHLLRELVQPCSLIFPHTSRQSSQMKYDKTIEGSRIPLALENVDSFSGIQVPTALGHAAYQFHYLHLRRGEAKEEAIENILNSPEIFQMVMNALEHQKEWQAQLENQLGMPLDEFAYLLIMMLEELGEGRNEIPLPFSSGKISIKQYPCEIRDMQMSINDELSQKALNYFKDWFQLRENIYDGVRLIHYQKKHRKTDIFSLLADIDCEIISEEFKIDSIPLEQFILSIRVGLTKIADTLQEKKVATLLKKSQNMLNLLSEAQHPGNHSDLSGFLTQIATNLELPLPEIPDWQQCSKLSMKIKRACKGFLSRDNTLCLNNTLEVHRYLCVLGELEVSNAIFGQMWNLINFISVMGEKVNLVSRDLENIIGNEDVNLENFTSLGYVETLARTSLELMNTTKKIKVLGMATPYIDEAMGRQSTLVNENLDKLSTLAPGWVIERVNGIKKICKIYHQALQYLKQDNLDIGRSVQIIGNLGEAYHKLNQGALKNNILILYKDWEKYLRKLQKVMLCINETKQDIVSARIELLSVEDLSSQFVDVVNKTSIIIQGGSSKEGEVLYRRFGWIMDAIVNQREPGVSLDAEKAYKLGEFLEQHKSFADGLCMKIFFK